ncbi:MAG: polyphosphate kinase 2 family protein, partial [Akkermansiaceae bacterium]|nr:polyphosphate kinase 2 family protein [Akkermansiaceae bacterium]
MPVKGALDKYLVKLGQKLNLAERETNDKALFDGSKEEHEPFLAQLREELKIQQNHLYAENKHRLLVVIQAMDTGGKDGTVKSVFSDVDPQGIHVEPFKKPSEDELARDFLWRVHSKV